MTGSAEADEVQRALGTSYALERELGRGGMGAVYLARDLTLDRPVAIKVLPPELAVRPELRERFLRETRTAASFSHPNIVPVHAVEERGAVLCFVMGFVDGETLAQRIRRAGPLPAAEIVRMMQEVAWALSYAHGRGVIHRDIKPDNILIERATGRALVMDFGIARSATSASAGLTRVGEVVGTPHYMSPEQASGDVVDARSDLYSLGVVAFSAATAHVPFDADSTPAILAMHLTRTAPPLATERPDLPPALTGAVDRLLQKDPADRFATGEALVEALDTARLARPEVAPSIRVFHAKAGQFLRNSLIILLLTPWLSGRAQYDGDRFAMLVILLSGVVALLLQVVSQLRDLARQGFSYEELRRGVQSIGAEQEETRARMRAAPDWAVRRRRRWRLVALGMLGSGACIAIAFSLRRLVRPGLYYTPPLGIVLVGLGAAVGMIVLVSAIAAGGGAARLDRAIRRLWTSRAGERLFALASRGLATARLASPPTISLSQGALGALNALPKPLRRELPDAATAIRRLEAEAIGLAQRHAGLEAALSQAAAPAGASDGAVAERRALLDEITAAQRELNARRDEISARLERVRLQLLRLRSGLGTLQDVTRELTAG